jgi:membrane protease YdiL (CAAX protease family)
VANLINRYPTISLFILAQILSGGIAGLVLAGVLPSGVIFLATFGTSVAGIILTAIADGKDGVRKLLGRLLTWRVGIGWWAVAALHMAVITLVGLYVYNLFGGPSPDLGSLGPLSGAIIALLMFVFTAGLGEELGWRGFLLPRLHGRYNALLASIVVAVPWALWHWMLFAIDMPGLPYYSLTVALGFVPAMLGFLVYLMAWSILHTWVYNNTHGSLLMMCLMHGSEAWVGYFLFAGAFDQSFRDLGELGGMVAVMIVAAIVVVVVYGPENLSKTSERYLIEDV